ncbi:MAG: hypothetical protein EU539_04450 [Promethearchaeota archaeon]|nr:MAG: hypothetical protein EU539_04450 [Candidatus Lokiarchaeota archaeon]
MKLYAFIITVIYYFKSILLSFTFIMIDHNSNETIKYENNIAKILENAVQLFRDTNLSELADKWERILNNYYAKRSFR